MKIQVNGTDRTISDGSSVADLLSDLQLDKRYSAVERNLQLVPREEHAECHLQPDDRIEIVTLVGGG
jgi:sulfur carrier protein